MPRPSTPCRFCLLESHVKARAHRSDEFGGDETRDEPGQRQKEVGDADEASKSGQTEGMPAKSGENTQQKHDVHAEASIS